MNKNISYYSLMLKKRSGLRRFSGQAFRFSGFFLAVCFSLACISAEAQSEGSSAKKLSQPSSKEYAQEAAVLLRLFDQWADASSRCDYDGLRALYHEKVSFWPSVAKSPFYGIDDTVNVFKGMCDRNPHLKVVPVERYVDILGDTAVVFGQLKFRRMLNDQVTDVPARFAFTLVKDTSIKPSPVWKILHMQSAVVQFFPEPTAENLPTESNPEGS